VLPDWEYVALNSRRVVLAFDSDVMLKAEVYGALRRWPESSSFEGPRSRMSICRPVSTARR